jgi:hypothetical protein
MTTATNGESGMPKAKPPQNGKASLKASRFFHAWLHSRSFESSEISVPLLNIVYPLEHKCVAICLTFSAHPRYSADFLRDRTFGFLNRGG